MKVVLLFDDTKGSWMPRTIAQGLIQHPAVQPRFSSPVFMWDHMVEEASHTLEDDLTRADLVIRMGNDHFDDKGPLGLLRHHKLLKRTLYVDCSDEPTPPSNVLRSYAGYIARVPVEGPRTAVMHYGVSDDFFVAPPRPRIFDVAYLFKPAEHAYNEHRRQCVWRHLEDYGFQNTYFGRVTTDHWPDGRLVDPRRNYTQALVDGNPVYEYLKVLRKARVVVTIPPDHGGGDGRLWEAFASGALVVTDYRINDALQKPFVDKKHCLLFDSECECSIEKTLHTIDLLLAMPDQLNLIALRGQEHAVKFHHVTNRVGYLIELARSWIT